MDDLEIMKLYDMKPSRLEKLRHVERVVTQAVAEQKATTVAVGQALDVSRSAAALLIKDAWRVGLLREVQAPCHTCGKMFRASDQWAHERDPGFYDFSPHPVYRRCAGCTTFRLY